MPFRYQIMTNSGITRVYAHTKVDADSARDQILTELQPEKPRFVLFDYIFDNGFSAPTSSKIAVSPSSRTGLVVLDLSSSEELTHQGFCRELISNVQALRKDQQLEPTDQINLTVLSPSRGLVEAILDCEQRAKHEDKISKNTLTVNLLVSNDVVELIDDKFKRFELDGLTLYVKAEKVNSK